MNLSLFQKNNMPKVSAKNITVTYQNYKRVDAKVLDDLSVSFPNGKISVIIGASGCGKSTLIRTISGIIKPDSGDILFDDNYVTYISSRDRNISYMNQDLVLYPKMNVFHNIAFPLEVQNISVEEIKERVNEVAELFDLLPLLTRKIKELSIGQAQRVLLAKAMIKKPSLYLLDEPFSNLDKPLSHALTIQLKKIFTKNSDTVIFISHDISDALAIADYIYVMEDGKFIAHGEPLELIKSKNEKVKAYFRDL